MRGEVWMEILTNIATSMIAVSFMTSYIGARYTGIKHCLLFAGGVLSYFLAVTALDFTVHFEGILGCIYSLILFGYARIVLKGKIWDELVASWIWVFIALFSGFVIFTVARLLSGYEFDSLIDVENRVRLEMLLSATALKILLCCIVLLFVKRRNLYLEKKEGWAMSVTYTAVFAIITGFFSVEFNEGDPEIRHVLSVILVLGLLFIVMWISFYYWKLSEFNEEKMQLEFLQNYIKNQKKYIKELGVTYEEMRILRHDLRGHLTNLYVMLKEGQYEKAAGYVEAKDRQIKEYDVGISMTDNQGLNAALLRARYLCKKEGIAFTYEIAGAVEKIEEEDLGILFYNLLNNAIEACLKVDGGRRIQLTIREQGRYVRCILRNSINDSVLAVNPKMISDKKDEKKHGYGLKSIIRIVEKYDGAYDCSEEEGEFIQKVLLKVSPSNIL